MYRGGLPMEFRLQDFIVYIVDTDSETREVLGCLIQPIGVSVKGFACAESFLQSYDMRRSGCLIVDVNIPLIGGLALQKELAVRNMHLPVLFIGNNVSVEQIAKGFRAGALDFLEKPCNENAIIERVMEAVKIAYFTRDKLDNENKTKGCFNLLTNREKEVLHLIINNNTNKEAAKILNISHRTIEAHRIHIMDKMQADNFTVLITLVAKYNLFDDNEKMSMVNELPNDISPLLMCLQNS
jgi:two-component system, LuxR family, response regulator FixJ